MEKKWTAAQLQAITDKSRRLLVSAGAGSGKTAVLTERIITRLTDPDAPADITRMLIVTFTKAAAGELKERISAALMDALAKNPTDSRLARQLLALDRANICTIHSFCLDLIRSFPEEAGISGDFSVADEAEIRLLRKSLMDELIEDSYSSGEIDDFPAFADTFIGMKSDERLADIFLGIDTELSSCRESIGFIESFAKELIRDSQADFGESRCGQEILSHVRRECEPVLPLYEAALPDLMNDPKLSKAYLTTFTSDIEFLRSVIAGENFEAVGRLFSDYKSPTLGRYAGECPPAVEAAKASREAFHKRRKANSGRTFSQNPDEIRASQLAAADMLKKLHRLLELFRQRFAEEKKKRSLIDFSDIEHLAVKLLYDGDHPSAAAETVRGRFDEIYIDEYQDVNSLQDSIFTAIAGDGQSCSRFMVGDIKQSIYAFRGAEPSIFASYRTAYLSGDPDSRTIFLSHNFRCDNPIIEFSNLVSAALFTNSCGTIPFVEGDKLVHGKLGEESGTPVKIVMLDKAEEDGNPDEVTHSEAEFIASEIASLLESGKKNDGTPIRPGDIAILMRSPKSAAAAIEDAFARRSIPLHNSDKGDFFENGEVLLALCLLQIIDNPTRDIYLAGALHSPLFGFTLDDLIRIRRHTSEGCLYDALKAYTADTDFMKGREFLDTLARYRRKAEGLPVDRLIWYLYGETDLPALALRSDNGNLASANLMLLYEYARRFEGSSFKGLYNFLRYLSDILEEKATLETAKISGEAEDTVRLMTIHQSKGLEFPVCFIAGCGKKFNDNDLRQSLVIDKSLGIACKLPDSTGFARLDSPIRQAILKRLSDNQLEEEMRVLYVAMTRARERLYITGRIKDPDKELDKAAASPLSRLSVMHNGGFLAWILLALGGRVQSPIHEIRVLSSANPVGERKAARPDEPVKPETEAIPTPVPDPAVIEARLKYQYPRAHLTAIPAKLSVSRLSPTVLDAASIDEDAEILPEGGSDTPQTVFKRPRFLEDSDPDPTGAERGTATHTFLQFCDFGRFAASPQGELPHRIREELGRMQELGFLTEREARLVRMDQLERFFAHPIFGEMAASPELFREHRFNVRLAADRFTADPTLASELAGETLLVQGVIDCFYADASGRVTLIDYKTDFIPRGMSRAEAEALLIGRHRRQLAYYKAACERILARPVDRVLIYSFALGDTVEVEAER